MAIPKWAQAHMQQKIDEGSIDYKSLGDNARSMLAPTPQPDPVWDAAVSGRQSRKEINGIDPALANVSDFDLFASQVNPEFAVKHPTITKVLAAPGYAMQKAADLFPDPLQNWANRAGQTGGEVMTLVDNPNKATTGSGVGDITADLFGGLMGFVGNPSPGGVESAGAKLWQGSESAIGKILPRIAPKAPKLAQDALKVGGATIPYELTNAFVNDRSVSPEEAGLAVGANVGLSLLTHGLGRIKGKEKLPEVSDDIIPEDMDWVPEAIESGGEYSWKKPILALPEGKGGEPYSNIPNWEFGTGKIDPEYQSKYSVKPLPRPASLNRNVDVASSPDKYPLPDVGNLEGRALTNRAKQEQLALPGGSPLALPEPFKPNWEAGRQPTEEEIISALAKQQKETVNSTQGQDKMDYGQEYPAENGIAKFKYATSTAKKATNDANKAFDIDVKDADRISLDEPAMSRPDMQLADKVANALSGTSIITAKMPSFMSKVQGFFVQDGKKIFLNSNMDDPATYVTLHEAGHKMEAEYPDEYGKMLEIAVNNLKDDHKALIERYQGRGYEIEDMPSEFFNDLMAEMLHDKSFIGRLHDQAPEVIKPLLQVLDDLIAKVKLALSKDDSVLPFIQDLERLRFEMAPEYQNYLKTVGEQPGNKFRKGWQTLEGIAAKQGEADIRFKMGSNQPSSTPLQNVKNLVMSSTAKLGNGNLKYGEWSKQMLAEHGSGVEKNLPYIWHRSQEMLTNGTTTIKIGEQEMPVTMPSRQAKSNLPGQKEKGAQGQDWNHVATKTDKSSVTVKGVANKVYETAFDDLNRLNQVDKEAYMQALNSREAGGVAKNIVEKGLADSQGNIIGESLKSITKQIPKGAANDFDNYLIYRHAPSWLEQGRKVFPDDEGITADVARQRAAAYEQAHPEFKELGDKIVKWQRDLGKAWLVDTGIIKPEAWAQMQEMYPDYIPFQRKMQEIETMPGSGKAKGKFANQSNPVKKAEGSQREIISPIESMIEHVEKYVKTAKRNEVMQTMHKNIQKDPEALKGLIEIIPEKGETFESVFAKDGMDGFINWMEEPFAQMKARKNMEYDKPNVVRGIVNGVTVHFKVNDPALLDTLATLSPQGQNNVVEFFRQGTRIMKVLTTGGNPIFATRNIARDLPMAYIASDTLVKTPILREVQFVWGMLDSFARIVTNGRYDPGSYYKTFKAMGGGTHSSSMAADRNLLAESKASVLPGYFDLKKPITGAGRGIKAAGRGIEQFTNAVETAPRLPEYIRTVKQGGDTYASRQKGLFNAQDVTVNFSRHGSVAKDADAFVPYLNAALQGIDKLGRIYSKDPIGAVYRSVVAVTVPAIGLWLINRDDPNYQKLSSWTRDNYFCIPLESGKFLKIAKPREAGVVFGSMAERALDKWANDDPNGFKGFPEAWIHSFAPPVRTIGAPVTDVIANKNFAGAPIVPGYMQRLSPEQQHDENTSAPAKALGKLTNSSPKKIDYLARSYTGVLGELGMPAASEGRGESAVQRIGNVLDKTFKADPLYSNDTLSYFYDAKDKLDTATSDYNATKTKGVNYNPSKAKIMNAASTKISDINKQIRAINGNDNMSYEVKDARVRSLKQKSLDVAEQALRRIGEVK